MHRSIRIGTAGLVAALLLSLVPAANAGQYIGYKGRTEQGHRMLAVVRRSDAGRLFLAAMQSGYSLTCDDASTQEWIVGVYFGRGPHLDEHRRVHVNENWGDVAIHYNGRLAWRQGTGTTKWTTAALDVDEQAMLCTSGRQGWSVRRFAWAPTLSDGKDVALRIGFARVRVGPAGVARLVRYRPPLV